MCKICHGEYNSVCDDGRNYYHACPESTDTKGDIVKLKDARNENILKTDIEIGRIKLE